jgi:hypothetical protein
MGQQFFARACFTQKQHRAAGLGRPARLTLEVHHRRTGPNEAGKTVARLTRARPCAALHRQGIAGFIEFTLQQGKFG